METVYKIVIADDHKIILSGIRQIIIANNLGEIVAEVPDGIELLKFLQFNSVNLVILDINMPNLNGVDAATKIKTVYPNVSILMISQYENIELIKKLKKTGINGYLTKNFEINELIQAIETIKKGNLFFPNLNIDNSKLKNKFLLTPREIEVLQLVVIGKKSKEIAQELFLSEFTINTHRKNLLLKLEVNTVLSLVNVAKELGYIF
jgi:DNA-binding NarL/FixJ family response regulator